MADCQDSVMGCDLAGYSQAAVLHSGLVVGSLFKRSGEAIVRVGTYLSDGARHSATAVVDTGKYSVAVAEYIGLISTSVVKRTTSATCACARKVIDPVSSAVSRPMARAASLTGWILRRRPASVESVEALQARVGLIEEDRLVDRVRQLEERIATLEKYGVRAAPSAVAPEPRKMLKEDRRMVLRAILEDNKLLRSIN